MFHRIRNSIPPITGPSRPLLATLAVVCAATLAAASEPPVTAEPATPPRAAGQPAASAWHFDLASARAAAASSQRPVLALFIASWSPECRRIAETLQASPEVGALVLASFEPAVVDVDAEADLTRRLQIVRVPTAVVLGQGDQPLATFDCPAEPPAFIGAVARASREVIARTMANGSATHADAARAGDPGRGSISMLATDSVSVSDYGGLTTDGTATHPVGPFASGSVVATPEPALPQSPPAWTAERPTAPLAVSAPATGPRPGIEPSSGAAPAGTRQASPAAPWLAAAVAADPESSASVSDLPPSARAEAAAAPPQQSAAAKGFWSGFRNPFARVEKPALPAAKPEPPPTMPPAKPQWPAPLAALVPQPAVQPPAQAAPAPATATAPPAAAETMPLGLEGYCPVTLAEKQAWAEGRPQYGARHRGRTYLFAGPEQQKAFLADPDRYAPALSGDDPVLAFEQGKSLPGQRRYGAYCQSRMYLFASPETRAKFEANPEKYAHRVTLAERSLPPATRTY